MTVDAVAPARTGLDRALSSLDWTLLDSTRRHLRAGELSETRRGSGGFVYVSTGRASVVVDRGESQILEAGDLLFLARPHERRMRAETDVETVEVAVVPRTGARSALDALPDSLVAHRFAEREPGMAALIGTMACTGSGPGRVGDAVICSRVATTIATVAVRLWAELGCAPRTWTRGADDPRIGPALDALHADLDRAWTVEELARVAMMSRSAFAARFREVVGSSPVSYLAAARVDSGIELLRAGDLSVTQVALRLGYGSEEGFSRAFRRHTGSTPAIWRAGLGRGETAERQAVSPEPSVA